MHGTVLRSLDGYIIVFMLSLKRVLWSARESVATCARTRRIERAREREDLAAPAAGQSRSVIP